jgi:ATP-dependent HslUV protease, peptidase subunit HslV
VLRRLEALLAVADKTASLIITGNGDVIEPEDAADRHRLRRPFAQAAPAPCWRTPSWTRAASSKGLKIAADICIYTNHNLTIEELAGG